MSTQRKEVKEHFKVKVKCTFRRGAKYIFVFQNKSLSVCQVIYFAQRNSESVEKDRNMDGMKNDFFQRILFVL